jgi:hypothetical protein
MIKRLLVMFALFRITFLSAQNVRYYKLTRKVEDGKSSTNVSGGQFITFVSDMCFESNKNGVGVGHGTMTRNKAYSDAEYSTYQGNSYWGKKADFKFNADKSILNVVLENGDVYVYKYATAPTGQETCSLIRKSGGGGGGGVVVTPMPIIVNPNTPTPTPTPTPTTPTPQKTHKCGLCGGSGEWAHDDESIPDFGTGNKYCSKCGKTVGPKHVHTQCPSCKGKGWW